MSATSNFNIHKKMVDAFIHIKLVDVWKLLEEEEKELLKEHDFIIILEKIFRSSNGTEIHDAESNSM